VCCQEHPEQGRHDENAAIAIFNIGRMDNGMKQQAQRVYENMSLGFLIQRGSPMWTVKKRGRYDLEVG
jgi:hypothetical protein